MSFEDPQSKSAEESAERNVTPLTRAEVEAFLARDAAENAPLRERLTQGFKKFAERQIALTKEYIPASVAAGVAGAILPNQGEWMLENLPNEAVRVFQGPHEVALLAQVGIFLLYAGAVQAWPKIRAYAQQIRASHGQSSPQTT